MARGIAVMCAFECVQNRLMVLEGPPTPAMIISVFAYIIFFGALEIHVTQRSAL